MSKCLDRSKMIIATLVLPCTLRYGCSNWRNNQLTIPLHKQEIMLSQVGLFVWKYISIWYKLYNKSYHLIYLLPYVTFQVNISGLRAATDTNRQTGRRLVWVFLLIVCFAVMVAQITDRVRHFLSEPVSVQVSVARNNSLLYPAVTVCNKVSYLFWRFLEMHCQIADSENLVRTAWNLSESSKISNVFWQHI